MRQIVTNSLTFGLILGTLLGAWMLIDTLVSPLSEDTALNVGRMFGIVFLLLTIPPIGVRRRGGRLIDAIKAGVIAGSVTFVLFLLFGIVRVNLFLDVIRHRTDWQGLLSDFQRSGFRSLRLYANYVYARQILLIPLFGAVGGTVSGVIGGLVASVRRPKTRAMFGK
jgi:hypothetical protein